LSRNQRANPPGWNRTSDRPLIRRELSPLSYGRQRDRECRLSSCLLVAAFRLGLFTTMQTPLAALPKCPLAVERPLLFNTTFAFGEKTIEFTWLEVAKVLALVERHDCRGHDIFPAGIFAGRDPLINEFLHFGL